MVVQDRQPSSAVWLTITGYPAPCFSEVFILKGVKVVCFDTVLEVLILKGVKRKSWLNRKEGQPGLADYSRDCHRRENLRRGLGEIKTSQLAGAPKPGGRGGGADVGREL